MKKLGMFVGIMAMIISGTFLLSQPTNLPPATVSGYTVMTDTNGLLTAPTNFFTGNLFPGTNIVFEETNTGQLVIHSTASGSGGGGGIGTNAWATMRFTNATETLDITTTPIAITNWSDILFTNNIAADLDTGELVIGLATDYHGTFHMGYAGAAGGPVYIAELYTNGSPTGIRAPRTTTSTSIGSISFGFAGVPLAIGDTAQVFVSQDAGSSTITLNDLQLVMFSSNPTSGVATNGFVDSSITNGLASTNYVNTATNNNLASANAALNTASNLLYDVKLDQTNGTAYNLAVSPGGSFSAAAINIPTLSSTLFLGGAGYTTAFQGGVRVTNITANRFVVSDANQQLTNMVDNGSDAIAFWDDSLGVPAYLTVGSGLAITGTTLATVGSAGETNYLGSFGSTNAVDRFGLPHSKQGDTNLLNTVSAGNGITITNEGTNIVFALTATASGEANRLGSKGATNSTHLSLAALAQSGISNLLFTISAGTNVTLTKQGDTNIVIAASGGSGSGSGETNFGGHFGNTNNTDRFSLWHSKAGETNYSLTLSAGSGMTLTNEGTNIVFAALTNGFVQASITNGLASTNYVQSITNGLASTNYVNTATNNNLTSANAYTDTATNGIISQVLSNGVVIGSATKLNFVTGANITFGITNTLGTNHIGIASSGGGTGIAIISGGGTNNTFTNVFFEGAISVLPASTPDGTVTVDVSTNQIFLMTLAEDTTVTVAGGTTSYSPSFYVTQDSTGGWDFNVVNAGQVFGVVTNGGETTVVTMDFFGGTTNVTASRPALNMTAFHARGDVRSYGGTNDIAIGSGFTDGGIMLRTNSTAHPSGWVEVGAASLAGAGASADGGAGRVQYSAGGGVFTSDAGFTFTNNFLNIATNLGVGGNAYITNNLGLGPGEAGGMSIFAIADTSTGMDFPSAEVIHWRADGTQRLYLTSTLGLVSTNGMFTSAGVTELDSFISTNGASVGRVTNVNFTNMLVTVANKIATIAPQTNLAHVNISGAVSAGSLLVTNGIIALAAELVPVSNQTNYTGDFTYDERYKSLTNDFHIDAISNGASGFTAPEYLTISLENTSGSTQVVSVDATMKRSGTNWVNVANGEACIIALKSHGGNITNTFASIQVFDSP